MNIILILQIISGEILPKPEKCPEVIYELIEKCWNKEENRPNFKEVCLKKCKV